MSNLIVKFKKLNDNARIPARALPGDLGFDLFALEPVHLYAGETVPVKTGIAAEFPEGWGAFIKPRSSQGKVGIDVFGGVVDSGYRGELIVLLHNANAPSSGALGQDEEIIIYNAGDKIAQLVLVPVFPGISEETDTLSETQRGSAGFGSTGR